MSWACGCAPSARATATALNGSKMWDHQRADADCGGGHGKTDAQAGARGITAFLIEKG